MLSAPPFLRNVFADRYRIDGELGRGGMATVYLAEDRKHARQVAIKVLRQEVISSLGAERFLREIGIAARLSHPHLVPLIDSGEAGGLLYSVSPYLPGGSLRERLERERQLPLAEAMSITREVGLALDYVHRSGYVHRDVKPGNILFADGHALLADFGVAHVVQAPGAEVLTDGGIAVGTPAYMSPEQASAERELDGRSDLYSLACVTFEMLAGTPPFQGGARTVMMRHIATPPPSVRALRPDVPPTVDQALTRGLAKDPGDRWSSVTQLVAALESPPGVLPRSTGSRTRTIAVLPFVNASPEPENEYLSDGITDELINALTKVEGLRVASRTSVFAVKHKTQDVRAIGVLLGASEILEGTVRRAGDRLRITAQLSSAEDGSLLWSHRYDRTVADVFDLQDEIAQTIVATLRATSFADLSPPEHVRGTSNIKAYGLYLRGRYAWNKRTPEGIAEGIRYFKEAIAEDPAYAPAYTGLADSYALQLDYRNEPVAEGFARAKAYALKAIALDERLADAHASLAWTLFVHDWDWDESGREFRRAIELDPRYASAHQWYSFQLASQGRFEEALVAGHTALELDPASVSVRRSLSWVYYYARRAEQGVHHVERAIALNPMAEESYRVLGMILAYQGGYEESVRVLREGLTLPGAGFYSSASLAYVLARAGELDEARSILQQLTDNARHEYVSPVAFATIHLGLDEHELALEWTERAFAERRGWLAYLRVHPLLDPVRGHPRFLSLVERMRL